MTELDDAPQRLRALIDHGSTLLVEAAAGTGKTALIAGRITMMLAAAVKTNHIAALSFSEFAAGELSERVALYVTELLDGRVPEPLLAALPNGLSDSQRSALEAASATFDQLTICTIHAFCQTLITAYAIDANIDPGARILEGQAAETVLDFVFDDWLERRLSTPAESDDPVVALAEQNPRGVARMLRKIAKLRLDHRRARAPEPVPASRPDVEFAAAVAELRRWFDGGPTEPATAAVIGDLETLVDFFGTPFDAPPKFPVLWRLAHPPQLDRLMAKNANNKRDKDKNLRAPKLKGAWKKVAGGDQGLRRSDQFERHFAGIAQLYRRLVGHVAGCLMWRLSGALDGVVDAYNDYKRRSALLDFDDLLYFARDLVRDNEAARASIAMRFRHILVDEFQDTDPMQAELFFRIAANAPAAKWTDSELSPGALFAVGDPKQAIYAFRGADVTTYDRAYAAIEKQDPNSILKISANFRSRPDIVEHVNACFDAPLSAPAQPGYVALQYTLARGEHDLPEAARLTVDAPENATAETLRSLEAAAVADVCARLIGNFPLKDRKLRPGDIALLAPAGTKLWHYEQALSARRLSFVSQAGKGLFERQETQDLLALVRTLADRGDALAFGALMRGPLVGLSEEELSDIVATLPETSGRRRFSMLTDPTLVSHPVATATIATLQALSRKAWTTTPFLILSEALEKLSVRTILAQRGVTRGARSWANVEALLERARPYGISGLRKFAEAFTRDWSAGDNVAEGRLDAEADTVQIVTMHSAKGLEWPVVIPINSTTWVWSPRDYVHRPDNDTLHWIIDDVRSPELADSLDVAAESKRLENARLWYVACTRARDLLIVPKIDQADARSYARILPLGQDRLPEWDMDRFEAVALERPGEPTNDQTTATFAEQRATIEAMSKPISWSNPSTRDADRITVAEVQAREIADAPELGVIIGAGRIRGLVLHKLIEEVLTGETDEGAQALTSRAQLLTSQLCAQADVAVAPDAEEMATAVLRTLRLPEIAAVRATLQPEWTLFVQLDEHNALAGRSSDFKTAVARRELLARNESTSSLSRRRVEP